VVLAAIEMVGLALTATDGVVRAAMGMVGLA
jgi:hypothetical protein